MSLSQKENERWDVATLHKALSLILSTAKPNHPTNPPNKTHWEKKYDVSQMENRRDGVGRGGKEIKGWFLNSDPLTHR